MKKSGATLMTDGPIWKRIILFAVPIFLGNTFQQLYNTADTLIVGNFLNKDALAAVSSSGSLIFLLIGFFSGISLGAGAAVSRHFGAGDDEQVSRAVHTMLAFGLVAGAILTTLGIGFTPTILRWMSTPSDVLPHSVSYFRMYFVGSLAFVLYNISVGILQAVGNSRDPLIYLIIASVMNVILDLLFVGVFGWGVWSAAFATSLSQGLCALLALRKLMTSRGSFRVSLRAVRFHKEMLREILTLGLPSGVQNSIIAFANIIVQSNINSFEKDAMAACGSYAKLEGFAFLPVTCFAMALTTFIGQNLGAKQYDRAKRGARFGIICSLTMAEVIGVILYAFAPPLIAMFNRDPEIIRIGTQQARVEALFYFALAFSHCIAGTMRGAGRAIVPMLVMMICWCIIRVTYLTVVLHFVHKITVVFWAYPLTWMLSSIIFLIYFVKGDWVHSFERLDAKKKREQVA